MRTVACSALAALVMGFAPGVASASSFLVGWYDFSTCTGSGPCENSGDAKSADTNSVASGTITATMYGGDGTRLPWSSTDGTFGPGPSTGDSGGNDTMVMRPFGGENRLFFTLVNNTGFDVTLQNILFDGANLFGNANAAQGLSFENDPASDLTTPTFADTSMSAFPADSDFFAGAPQAVQGGTPDVLIEGDWADYSIDFSLWSDATLANGETAVIFLSLFRGDGGTAGAPIAFDNIAITGSVEDGVVPAPAALPLLLTGLAGLALMRRRRVQS